LVSLVHILAQIKHWQKSIKICFATCCWF